MVRTCFVPSCNSKANYNKKAKRENVTLFRVPKDQKLRQQWERNCGRCDRQMKETDYVCSKHFTKDDISSEFRIYRPDKVDLLKKLKVTLRKNAVPTIFEFAKKDTERNGIHGLPLSKSVKNYNKTVSSFSLRNSCHSGRNKSQSIGASNCRTSGSYKSSAYIIESEESVYELPGSNTCVVSLQKIYQKRDSLNEYMNSYTDLNSSTKLTSNVHDSKQIVTDSNLVESYSIFSKTFPESAVISKSDIFSESGVTSESGILSDLGTISESDEASDFSTTSESVMSLDSGDTSSYCIFLQEVYRIKLPSSSWSAYIYPEESTVVFLCLNIECKPKITVKFCGSFTPVVYINGILKDPSTVVPLPKSVSDVCIYLNSLDKLKICIGTGMTECPYSEYCVGLLIFNERNTRCEYCSNELKNSKKTQYINSKQMCGANDLIYLNHCKKIKYLQYQARVLKSNMKIMKKFCEQLEEYAFDSDFDANYEDSEDGGETI